MIPDQEIVNPPDVVVVNEGNLFCFHLQSERALEWVRENVHEHQMWAGILVVEPRFALNVASGMMDDGLVVE